MGHQIKLDDLTCWKNETLVLFASSGEDQKRLYSNLHGGYELHHKGKKIWEGIQSYSAIEKYNKI